MSTKLDSSRGYRLCEKKSLCVNWPIFGWGNSFTQGKQLPGGFWLAEKWCLCLLKLSKIQKFKFKRRVVNLICNFFYCFSYLHTVHIIEIILRGRVFSDGKMTRKYNGTNGVWHLKLSVISSKNKFLWLVINGLTNMKNFEKFFSWLFWRKSLTNFKNQSLVLVNTHI